MLVFNQEDIVMSLSFGSYSSYCKFIYWL